ncbi:ABC transporter ATP-binding protein [soil metagenome]
MSNSRRAPAEAALACHRLSVAVPGRVLVADLDLAIAPRSFVCLLGENGSGKTLTLHTLAGIRPPSRGDVSLLGVTLDEHSQRRRARALGLLAQHDENAFPSTVLEAVLIGRHPHVSFWRWESPEDIRLARAALARVDLADMEERPLTTLSGGERRRVAIAAVLAQNPAVYLLDEPLNHLDPHHQLDVLRLFTEEARNGKTVIASLHDVNMAARFADSVLLLFGDGSWIFGPADSVLAESHLSRLYRLPLRQFCAGGQRIFLPSSGT